MKILMILSLLCSTHLWAKVRVAVFNDLNGSLGNPKYSSSVHMGIKGLIKKNPDLAIAPGDIVSGEDYTHLLPESTFDKMWKSFSKNIHSKLKSAGIPFAPAPGNHDANASYTLEVQKYGKYFFSKENTPSVRFIDDRKFPFYYSYMMDNVFFIALDDTKTWRLWDNPIDGQSQREWIQAQLKSMAAQTAVARIVYGHVPLYSVLNEEKHNGKYKEVLTTEQYHSGKEMGLEKLLLEGNVDLTIFAHSHAFYPGVVQHKGESRGLHMLFSPCLGPGKRYLNGNFSERSTEGFSIIDVEDNGEISYRVYTYKDKLIDSRTLPSRIISNNNVIISRDDDFYRL